MIAFAPRFKQLVRADEREKTARRWVWDAKPFRNTSPPNVGYCALDDLRKCVAPGCIAHIAFGPYCGSCGVATVPLKEWRRAVDAGEIVR